MKYRLLLTRRTSGLLGRLLVVCALAASVGSAAAQTTRPAPPTLLKAARLLDVEAGAYRDGQAVLIEGERIVAVGPLAEVRAQAPAGVTVIDLGDRVLMPGLIDCHTHLFDSRSPAINFYENNLIRLAQGRKARQALWAAANARNVLQFGFTTVRDMGESGGNGDAALRDAIRDGWVVGPRVIPVTKNLTPPGGLHLYVQTVETRELVWQDYLVVRSPDEAGGAVREAVHLGAEWIKVIADDGNRRIGRDVLAAVVAAAHEHDLRVAAHAHTPKGAADAVAAGVDSLEHGNDATDETFAEMARRGTFLVVTDLTADALADLFGKTLAADARPPAEMQTLIEQQARSGERLRRAHAAGVRLAYGSDTAYRWPGKTRGQTSLLCLDALAAADLPAADIVRAITSGAADCLGRSEQIGTIAPGKYADLIAVEGDPLAGPADAAAALRRATFIMKGGVVVDLAGRDEPLPDADRSRG